MHFSPKQQMAGNNNIIKTIETTTFNNKRSLKLKLPMIGTWNI